MSLSPGFQSKTQADLLFGKRGNLETVPLLLFPEAWATVGAMITFYCYEMASLAS